LLEESRGLVARLSSLLRGVGEGISVVEEEGKLLRGSYGESREGLNEEAIEKRLSVKLGCEERGWLVENLLLSLSLGLRGRLRKWIYGV